MSAADIVRVWGTADEFNLELKNDNGRWVCDLLPDLTDGQYAVQLFAERKNGMVGMWTGMLYVANGICHLELKNEKITFWLLPEKSDIRLNDDRYRIELVRECLHE